MSGIIKKSLYIAILCVLASCGSHRSIENKGSTAPSSTQKTDKDSHKRDDKLRTSPIYTGIPWVQSISQPYTITEGLQNRHLSLWASHGRYYNNKKRRWEWQRPYLFCTTEDLFTQTIVVPYLIPMLENAGANVFTPRERDWQRHEIVVDNDDINPLPYYTEINIGDTIIF